MSSLSNRYNINSVVVKNDPQLAELTSKYETKLQGLIGDSQFIKSLNDKAVTALFLDRMSQGHLKEEEKQTLQKFGYSSSVVNSMKMIHYLEGVKNDHSLAPTTKEAIEKWIQSEREYLQIAIIFDGWRAENPQVMSLIQGGTASAAALLPKIAIQAPADEIERLAESIAKGVQSLKPGESYKMLGGFNIHETRIWIHRNADLSFTLYHYNTAGTFTLMKYTSPPTSLDKIFWKTFIELKLKSTDINGMNNFLLKELNVQDQKDVELFAKKSKQLADSCAGQAADASLKHQIVLSSSNPGVGEKEYKLLKSLMVKQAVKEDKEVLDPVLYTLLQSKERVKSRYFLWHQLEKDPQKMQEMRDLYVQLIAIFDPNISAPRENLHALDAKLHFHLTHSTKEKIEQALEMYKRFSPEGTLPIPCLKFHERASQVQNVVQDTQSKMGSLSAGVKRWIGPLLPASMKHLAAPPQIDKKTILDLVRTEKEDKARAVIEKMVEKGVLQLDDYRNKLESSSEDFLKVFAPIFFKKLPPQDPLMLNLKAYLDPSQLPREIPIMNRLGVLAYLQLGNHKEKMLELMKNFVADSKTPLQLVTEQRLHAFPEPLGAALKERVLLGKIPWKEVVEVLQYISPSDQIEILNTFSNIDFDTLVQSRTLLHAQTVYHLYNTNQLSEESAGFLFTISLKSTPLKDWAEHLPLFLEERMISIDDILHLLRDPYMQKEIAAKLLEYGVPNPNLRLLCLRLFPEKYLQAVSENPALLEYFETGHLDKFSNENLWHLAQIASPTSLDCLSYCLVRLADDKSERESIRAFFNELVQTKQLTESKIGSVLLNMYKRRKDANFIQTLYHEAIHTTEVPQGEAFEKLRQLNVL